MYILYVVKQQSVDKAPASREQIGIREGKKLRKQVCSGSLVKRRAEGVEPQLYMWSGTRRRIIDRHNFYVEQVRSRVLSQFNDIEGDAEQFAEREYDRLASAPAREDIDLSDLAEAANDRAQGHYGLLHDLKGQTILGAVAGMYHQWEKDLRNFVERELAHNYKRNDAEELAWSQRTNMFGLLKEFGWDCSCTLFFSKLNACRLVVNVYKHGKGSSLTKLAESYPEYVRDSYAGSDYKPAFAGNFLDHEWLIVSAVQFDDFAQAIRLFWLEFPERLFLKVTLDWR
jgi:hypothetical protein